MSDSAIKKAELFDFVRDNILSGLTVTTRGARSKVEVFDSYKEEKTEDGVRLVYDCTDGISVTVTARCSNDAVCFFIEAKRPTWNGDVLAFAAENAVSFKLGGKKPDSVLSSYHDSQWWMMPGLYNDFTDLKPKTQSLLAKFGDKSFHMLFLCGDNFRCEAAKGELSLNTDMSGLCSLTGAFLSVCADENPLKAVENNYKAARKTGAVRVPLRTERQYPVMLEGFGFCSWDAFYRDVTSEKLYAKLDEFKQKNIPVKWIIIDDGWMSTRGDNLTSFIEDRTKFPEGLKETVRRIKEEYAIEKVGVWHAFNGYWTGVEIGSELYNEQKDHLMITPGGRCACKPNEDDVFAFFDAWHSYLAACGVDFVKIDNQSSNVSFYAGVMPTAEATRIYHKGLERSINKNFCGTVINCMGMDMENVLARPGTSISRNSDDFYPRKERGFTKHLIQNIYNAIWHSQTNCCDFDMWWSDHESAVQSGVLRAISGSPIYVSDEIGGSSAENILPTVEDNGMLMRCDDAALPTLDTVYTDYSANEDFVKIFIRSGDCFALAAFNVCTNEISGKVDFGAINGIDESTDYAAYEYFSKNWTRANAKTVIDLTLAGDKVAVWSLYPINKDEDGAEYILAGSCDKYVPIASKNKTKAFIKDIF